MAARTAARPPDPPDHVIVLLGANGDVQIDVPETVGLTTRTRSTTATGAYRDMVVTRVFQYSFASAPDHAQAQAYERLVQDAMIGDRMLFTSAEGVERLWDVSAPLLADPPPLRPYAVGARGVLEADELIGPYRWHSEGDER